MFEKVGQLAERVATNVSRRELLGQLGLGALAVAAAAADVLALPAVARGDRRPYLCPEGSWWRCVGQLEGFACDFGSVCKRGKHSSVCDCV
jgi:hypothetical protein